MDTKVGSYKSWWQYLVTVRSEYNRHPGNTTGFSWVAAEAFELSRWTDGDCCFFYISLFVLSYSGLGLLSLQSLRGQSIETVGVSVVVLSCSGLGLLMILFWGPGTEGSPDCCSTFRFGTWSTLSLLEDQVPNFSHCGKTLSWSNFFICAPE